MYSAPITSGSTPSLIFKVSTGAFALFGIGIGPATSNPTTTATALGSSANPSTGGQQVTFTAKVTPAPNGGTVAFTDGGAPISGCSAVSLASGAATCSIVYGAGGSHTIQATYSGDSAFASSQSPTLTQIVNSPASATTTPLQAASNPSTTGTTVIYTAHVSPIPDGGAVAFFDAGLPVPGCGASAISSAGTTTCSATYDTAGLRLIQAAFSGDTNFVSSQSSTLREQVQSAVTIVRAPRGKGGRVRLVEACAAQASVNCQTTITLNRIGRRLLASFGKLPVTLTVDLAKGTPATVVLRKTLTVKPARRHRSRRKWPAGSDHLVESALRRARSSVGERSLHTREVAGSSPAAPTQ